MTYLHLCSLSFVIMYLSVSTYSFVEYTGIEKETDKYIITKDNETRCKYVKL
ncbi:MAG: hypothetical protein K6G28_06070 [Acholeplasmatales bacterium]|nr:hypothetical protein [Acholeplasmatales bacterium]